MEDEFHRELPRRQLLDVHVTSQLTVKLLTRAVISIELNNPFRRFIQVGPEGVYRYLRKQQLRCVPCRTANGHFKDVIHIHTVIARGPTDVKAGIHRFVSIVVADRAFRLCYGQPILG